MDFIDASKRMDAEFDEMERDGDFADRDNFMDQPRQLRRRRK